MIQRERVYSENRESNQYTLVYQGVEVESVCSVCSPRLVCLQTMVAMGVHDGDDHNSASAVA